MTGTGRAYFEMDKGTRGPVRRIADTPRDLFFSRCRGRECWVREEEKGRDWDWMAEWEMESDAKAGARKRGGI